MNYQIKSGDNLTKIAREQYGLQGGEAYKKALEIAKENNIKNPNLIFTGSTLKLSNTLEDKKNAPVHKLKPQSGIKEDAFEKGCGKDDTKVLNEYQKLQETQKLMLQSRFIAVVNDSLDDKHKIENVKFNLGTDSKFRIAGENAVMMADEKIFDKIFDNENVQEKASDYKASVLKIANQQIEAQDKADAKGNKDGKINYDEFKEDLINTYRATYEPIEAKADRNRYIQQYEKEHGKTPTEAEITKAVGQNKSNYAAYDSIAKQIFTSSDLDGSGCLDSTEIATSYMMLDWLSSTTSAKNSLKITGDDPNKALAEFDGIIDLNTDATTVGEANIAMAKETHRMFFGSVTAA